MSFLDKLERALGRFAIPNLTLYLVIGQVFVLLGAMLQLFDPRLVMLVPVLARVGQWWRIVTFLFLPPFPSSAAGYVFLVFGWYLFYLMGSALEGYWGTFRYNVFLFLSYALTVGLSFATPGAPVTNTFILGSVFLAFAYLNPDFELLIFFILPVKIKWLALLAWAWGTVLFIMGDLAVRLQIGASIASFALFFGGDILRNGRASRRTKAHAAAARREDAEPRHRCYVCGKTDLSHPQLDFRYCSKCAGDQCYCPEHIHHHAHVVAADDAKAR
ncbi:MAG TPA: hypothetical protein VHD62_12115 [Opitutaceae bacterium]|nr:hypothetical protein [Opitutaceae bacterium]